MFHFAVCKQMWTLLNQKPLLQFISRIVLLKKAQQVRHIRRDFEVILKSRDGRSCVLLWRTSPRALGEGENVWGHTMWPLAEAAGPPLVQSQTPKPSTPHLPDTQQPSPLPDRCTYGQSAETRCVFVGRLSVFSVAVILHLFWSTFRRSFVPFVIATLNMYVSASILSVGIQQRCVCVYILPLCLPYLCVFLGTWTCADFEKQISPPGAIKTTSPIDTNLALTSCNWLNFPFQVEVVIFEFWKLLQSPAVI